MVYVIFICDVLYFQCFPMDSIGDNYKYFREILWSSYPRSVMDIHDFYGHLYSFDISRIMVFAEKGKIILFLISKRLVYSRHET